VKNNIEYYQHFADAHNHPKFKTLRVKYGWEGEGRFWALNNMIADAENCLLDLEKKYNKAAVASDLGMNLEDFDAFIQYLIDECSLLYVENGCITTEIVQENLARVVHNRKKAADYRNRTDSVPLHSGTEVVQKQQSKVKESKVNNTAFESWYEKYPRKIAKAAALKAWKARMNEGISADELTRARDGYKSQTDLSNPKYILHPSTFLGPDRRWIDYLPKPPPTAPPRKPCPKCQGPIIGNGCPACGWSIDDGA